MKRVWSSYNLNKQRGLTSRKIQSDYNDIIQNLEIKNHLQKKSKEIKHLNIKYLTNLKSRIIKHKLNSNNIFTKKKDKNFIRLNDLSNDTNNLLDSIKVQSGINKFLNIVGITKGKEKANRMISTGTFLDFSDRNSIRKLDNYERIKTSNTSKKKRSFSSNLNLKKNEFGKNDINDKIKSYLIKLDKKTINSIINKDNDDILNKTLSPKTEKKVYYTANNNFNTWYRNILLLFLSQQNRGKRYWKD